MNVLVALIGVILMQVAATLMEVTPALVTVDTQAMDFLAHVSSVIYYIQMHYISFVHFKDGFTENGGCHQNCYD